MVELVGTTNPKFKYLEGTKTDEISIGVVIWFNNFHTSALKKIEYEYTDDATILTATTLNSVYIFRKEDRCTIEL